MIEEKIIKKIKYIVLETPEWKFEKTKNVVGIKKGPRLDSVSSAVLSLLSLHKCF